MEVINIAKVELCAKKFIKIPDAIKIVLLITSQKNQMTKHLGLLLNIKLRFGFYNMLPYVAMGS